ncbi:MAG: xanthine dehydrogenase family protein molybdopterin-binding subunit [Planctomycetes bacterium]|nr:xanthine dehydrogenase family protein molybdopterin-binding subunit [Planctomycetota bacterium]
MAANTSEIKIRVGFGDSFRDLTVRIAEGDVPPYEPGTRFDVIGAAAPRLDAEAKVTGSARFTYDQNLPGLLHGKILRCPHPNANVKSVDLTAARAMPGVKAAISFPEVFRTEAVRFAWEGIAAVAAESEAQAEAALRAIAVEYEVLPFCVTREDAMKDGAPQVGRRNQQNVRRIYPEIPFTRDGTIDEKKEAARQVEMREAEAKVDRILKESDTVVQGTFYTQVQTHSPLETHGVVCTWENESLVCYCSTQATFAVRHELTHHQGPVRATNARVLCEYVGGGFGAKFGAGREGVAGALLAKAAGRPVKVMLDRREEHTTTGNRPDSHQVLAMAVAKTGEIRALRARSWGTAGTSPAGAGAHNDVMYELGEIDKIEYGVRTNANDARPLRAPGFPQGVFALEAMMDIAAASIGMDPIEFRKKNDAHPVRRAEYDIACERIGWAAKRGAPAVPRGGADGGRGVGPLRRGVGCASSLWFASGGGGAKVLVRVHKNGTVEVRNGAQDIGTGTRTILGMVVAEELGIRLADVATFIGDTNDPAGPGSGGSTTAPTLTPAARVAAHRAKRQLLDAVARAEGWDAGNLDLRGGKVVGRDGAALAREIDFRAACGLIAEDQIEVLGERPVLDKDHPNYGGLADTNAGVQCAEVEVDVETGLVRVLKVVAVADAGKLINPKLAESQVRGGVIQGVSYALYERRIMDRIEGRMVNADFEFYKILGAVDCPEIEVVLLDVFMGHNNTHVMGLGEPPVVATAAAVANAVAHAIGVRIHSLPITPRKVLAALAGEEVRG